MRPEKVQIVGPALNTITSYYLIFMKSDLGFVERALKMLSNEPKTTFWIIRGKALSPLKDRKSF